MFNSNLLSLFKQQNDQKPHQQSTCSECTKTQNTETTVQLKALDGSAEKRQPQDADDFESLEYLLMAPGQHRLVSSNVSLWTDWDSK